MGEGAFPQTRASVVADLASEDPVRRARSLEAVLRAYWRPIYKHVRVRWSKPSEDAEDIVQAFFERVLDRGLVQAYEPGRARFRTFLRACVDRFVIDDYRRATAQRRGGALAHMDFADAERSLADHATVDPEQVFDAEWLRHLMTVALERLDAYFTAKGKPIHAALFRELHTADTTPSYAEAAARHGISVSDVTNWLHVARREFRRIALELLRELTIDDDDFAAEAAAVFGMRVR